MNEYFLFKNIDNFIYKFIFVFNLIIKHDLSTIYKEHIILCHILNPCV